MASEETWKSMPISSAIALIINMRQANDAQRKMKNTIMNRSIYRRQARTRNSAPPSADPSFPLRKVVTLPPPGVVVLDPFAGSASTGVGCLHAAGTKSLHFIG